MFATFRSQASAYGQIQAQTGVAAGDPHQLVAMLFDGALSAIAAARGALQRGDIGAKGQHIGQAVRIVEEGLRCALDQERGGELARNLNDVYAYVNLRLTQANLRNDAAALHECQALLAPIREAWMAIRAQPRAAA